MSVIPSSTVVNSSAYVGEKTPEHQFFASPAANSTGQPKWQIPAWP